MNIKYIIGGITVTAITIITGGSLYADQKLEKIYQMQHDSALKIKVNEFDMGLLSGKAKTTVSLALDPCYPENTLSFEVMEDIKRNFTGYTITSRIAYPYEVEQQLKRFFNDQDPLTLTSQLYWSGKAKLHLHSPTLQHQEGDFFLQSKGIDFKLDLAEQDYKHLKDISLIVPSVTFRDQQNYFEVNNLKFNTNDLHLAKLIPNSKSIFSADAIRIKSYSTYGKNIDFNFEKLNGLTENILKDQAFQLKNSFSIEEIQMGEQSTKGTLKFNLAITDVDEKLFQNFYQVIDRNSSVCNSNADQEVLQAFLKVLGQGLKIESKENIIAFNNESQLRADFEASLNKGNYQNLDTLMATLPMQLTAQGRVETSKEFLAHLVSLGQASTITNKSDYVDGLIQNLMVQGMLQTQGNKLVSRFEYKFGEPRFTNY